MARRLIVGARSSGLQALSPEQEAALLLCDSIADMFDPLLGGLDHVSRDDLSRMVAPLIDLRDLTRLPKEQRRARGVLAIESAGARALEIPGQRDRISQTLVLRLARVSDPLFERLETRTKIVSDELAKYGASSRPGPGKRSARRIFARLCVESGAFIEGGGAASYKPPRNPADRELMIREVFDATKKATMRESARRPAVNKGTSRVHSAT